MSEFDLTEDLEPDEGLDEEEFEGTEPGPVSPDTGTQYDPDGEPGLTPHDVEPETEDGE